MSDMLLSLYVKTVCAARSFKSSERGDTNFISILIILAVVVGLAGLFIGFSNDIISQVKGTISDFQFNTSLFDKS